MKKLRIILLAIVLSIAARTTGHTQQINLQNLYSDYTSQGLSCFEKNQLSNAKCSFWKAIQLIPNKNEAYINMAAVSMKRGNFSVAISILKKAQTLSDEANQDIIFYNLGVALQKTAKDQEAIEYYNKAILINPQLGDALFNLGVLYLKNNAPEEALVNFIKAGTVFQEHGQKSLAYRSDEIARSIIKTSSQNKKIIEKLFEAAAKSFENSKYEEAAVFLKVSSLLDPKNEEVYYRLGIVCLGSGHLEQAIGYFKKTITIDPKNAKAYINLGGAYGKRKEYKEALNALHKAAKLEKNNPKIYYNIAMAYLGSGNNKDAFNYLKKAKTLANGQENAALLERINEAYKSIKAGS